MKKVKRLLAVLLMIAMVLAFAVPAMAVDGENSTEDDATVAATGSITIIPKDNGAHTFTAYQIFKGELSASGVLSNVDWGNNMDNDAQSAFLGALKTSTDTFTSGDETKNVSSYFASCTTAASVAEALDKLFTDADEETAAKAVTDALNNLKYAGQGETLQNTDGKYVASNLPVGYYLVEDKLAEGATGAKASDMILQVVGNVTVTAKADIPEVTKKADGDSYGIGDEIEYTLTATVPDYKHDDADTTDTYKLEFTDTMSSALDLVYTYQANVEQPLTGITVKMGETNVTKEFDITYKNVDGKHVLTVSCDDISKINGVSADSVFTVTYKAKINNTYTEGAVDNKVTLVTKDYTSTDITENVFPIKLQVLKVDGANKDENGNYTKKLEGAQFTLQNDEGKYLQVNNGKVNGWVAEGEASTLTTDVNGEINVTGLAAGTYTLTETVAPDGYNLAAAPFELVITAEVNQTGEALEKLTISVNGATEVSGDKTNNTVTATIENNQGAQLPSTGGMGTTIFYVIGGILVVGAVVLLVTRKRMNAE